MKRVLFFISIILIVFISCDDDIAINLGNSPQNTSNFQVDFDGVTFTADLAVASIINGVTTIKAVKNDTNEVVIIILNRDQIGNYTFSPNGNQGIISYQKEDETIFTSSATEFSGRVDLDVIDTSLFLLSGEFSFIGKRIVQQLDNLGNPIPDGNGGFIMTEEIKNFTNGMFTDISFSLTVPVITNPPLVNEFFMNLDANEFIETTLSAVKSIVSGVEIITIKATNNGSNHKFELKMPANIAVNTFVVQSQITDPALDVAGLYTILSPSQSFGAVSGAIVNPELIIDSHDVTAKRIVGHFEFSTSQIGGGSITHEFTEGTFALTYTD